MNRIRISDQRLAELKNSGEDIDQWLRQQVGIGNWTEWIGIISLPYRSFSFKDSKYESMFILKWL
jgi:hypothetical protein